MKVRVRHIDDIESKHFAEVLDEDELSGLISFVKRSGGFYRVGYGEEPFNCYQLVYDGDFEDAYIEILIGEEHD